MNWKELNKKAILLLANGKIKRISNDKSNFGEMFEVGDELENYIVRVVTETGCNKILCSCKNGSLHPDGLCYHRIAVILFCQRGVFK